MVSYIQLCRQENLSNKTIILEKGNTFNNLHCVIVHNLGSAWNCLILLNLRGCVKSATYLQQH